VLSLSVLVSTCKFLNLAATSNCLNRNKGVLYARLVLINEEERKREKENSIKEIKGKNGKRDIRKNTNVTNVVNEKRSGTIRKEI
jgi:hypothetical protein